MKVQVPFVALLLLCLHSVAVDAFWRFGTLNRDDVVDDTADDKTDDAKDDKTDDGGLIPEDQPCDSNWEQTKADYEANSAKWGSPDCYAFTIVRSCFCSDVIRKPARVRVVNGTIVKPPNYEELFLRPMDALFTEVFQLCVKDCPDRGAAQCNITYGAAGNLQHVFIDRSKMIADEEIRYDIYNYTTC